MKRLWKRCYRQQDIWSSYQFVGMIMRGKTMEFWTVTSSLLLKIVWQDKHVHVSMLSTKQRQVWTRLNCCWLDLRLWVVSFFDPTSLGIPSNAENSLPALMSIRLTGLPPTGRYQTSSSL
ncbi:hypothetical protein BLNAU_9249 [Blattamonas nauphoetae]|uniref:Uncharacterized protein n=1 Tax=Blattamonas nauphoetae TaxID=2049346 RepID=A0ABQ9XW46_9EUKA|nr:hypothetical protein BLNAU_9249 [Blattamonas nauphoetae]